MPIRGNIHVVCSSCREAVDLWLNGKKFPELVADLRRAGWYLDFDTGGVLCPGCALAATPAPKPNACEVRP